MIMKVDTALAEVPVNLLPLLDDTDFKTRETAIAYNAAGMDLVWNFVTVGGAFTQTAVTPTTAGDYDWTHQGDGIYTIEIPASGGASINNDTEGFGWFSGVVTGVLPWRGPVIRFVPANIADSLVNGTDLLQADVTQWLGTAAATPSVAGVPEVDVTHIAGAAVATTSAQLGVNVVNAGGTAWGSGAITAAVFASGALDAVWSVATRTLTSISDSSGVTTLLSKLTGITSLAEWLGLLAGKQTGNATARTELRATGAGAGTFDETTDALEAVRDRGDAAWTTASPPSAATIADAVWDELRADHVGAGSFGEGAASVQGNVTGSVGSVTGAVGSVTGNVGGNVAGSVASVTAGVTVTTNNDKTGYAIGTGGIAAAAFAAGAIDAAALNASAVDEILDDTIGDSTITVRQALKVMVAGLAGKLSGAATTSISIRNIADDTNVIVATVDADGNRSAVTLTV